MSVYTRKEFIETQKWYHEMEQREAVHGYYVAGVLGDPCHGLREGEDGLRVVALQYVTIFRSLASCANRCQFWNAKDPDKLLHVKPVSHAWAEYVCFMAQALRE